jgi:hypothetical protein
VVATPFGVKVSFDNFSKEIRKGLPSLLIPSK